MATRSLLPIMECMDEIYGTIFQTSLRIEVTLSDIACITHVKLEVVLTVVNSFLYKKCYVLQTPTLQGVLPSRSNPSYTYNILSFDTRQSKHYVFSACCSFSQYTYSLAPIRDTTQTLIFSLKGLTNRDLSSPIFFLNNPSCLKRSFMDFCVSSAFSSCFS